jgi:hypothetical protein
MPLRYDSVLVGALAGELARTLDGRRLEELHFDTDGRQISLVLSGGERLVWLLHPTAGHVLLQVGKRGSKIRQSAGRGVLQRAARITDVISGPDERRIMIRLSPIDADPAHLEPADGGASDILVVELHTNQWNALLVSGGTIRAVLWRRQAGARHLFPGSEYRSPEGARRWGASQPDEAEWERWWHEMDPDDRAPIMLRDASWVSRLNLGYLLRPDVTTGPDSASVLKRLDTLRTAGGGQSRDTEVAAWTLIRGSTLQPYPLSLEEPDAVSNESLLEAMATSAERMGVEPSGSSIEPRAAGEVAELDSAIRQRAARARKRCKALERQLEQQGEASALRSAGQLLLMNKDRIRRGDREVVVEDFDGAERRIPLDPARDPIENAEACFRRARRQERAERELPARIAAAQARLTALEAAVAELAATGPTDELWKIVGGRAAAGEANRAGGATGPLLPYRRLVSSGGLEIRVGRSSRSNDALTFRYSAPDDIWLHARQAAGAHVILRWGNREQNPPEADLRDAALAAADSSEARSSGLVAVDWTRRKYVRKPRKAAAGAVIPDRVKTLFVEPDPERVRQMKEAGPDSP